MVCALPSPTLFSTLLMMSIIRLNQNFSSFSLLLPMALLCTVVQINKTSPVTSTGVRSARIAPAARVRAAYNPRDHSLWTLLLKAIWQLDVPSARCILRDSAYIYEPTPEIWKKESVVSFQEIRPLLHSSVGSVRGQSPVFLMFPTLEENSSQLLQDTERAPLFLNHSPSLLVNLLSLADESGRPSWPYIAASLIRNALHAQRIFKFPFLARSILTFFFPLATLNLIRAL